MDFIFLRLPMSKKTILEKLERGGGRRRRLKTYKVAAKVPLQFTDSKKILFRDVHHLFL